jgi:DNA repair protein RadC
MNELLQLQIPYPLPKLKRLPLREQPAYRMTRNPDACNLTELLAVLVGGPQQIEIAEALLERFASIRKLHQAHAAEIASIKGVGQGTALRLKAALELGKRAILETEDERPSIHGPADAASLVQYEMSLLEQEYLKVILLDTRNRVIDIVEIYHGSLNSSQVRVAELFKPAILRMAAAVIVTHNHPSGDPAPSPDDVAVTRAIVQAGKLLDVEVLDHVVIGHNGRYVSLKERGLGFEGRVSEAKRRYRLNESEVIYAYTRAQALADGVLIDISSMAKEAGFRHPTAITADLHATLTPNRRERSYGQSYEGRLWDVLFMARLAARRAIWDSQTAFSVSQAVCPGERGRLRRRSLNLWLVVGPGDEHEPVITIGFPENF